MCNAMSKKSWTITIQIIKEFLLKIQTIILKACKLCQPFLFFIVSLNFKQKQFRKCVIYKSLLNIDLFLINKCKYKEIA